MLHDQPPSSLVTSVTKPVPEAFLSQLFPIKLNVCVMSSYDLL